MDDQNADDLPKWIDARKNSWAPYPGEKIQYTDEPGARTLIWYEEQAGNSVQAVYGNVCSRQNVRTSERDPSALRLLALHQAFLDATRHLGLVVQLLNREEALQEAKREAERNAGNPAQGA